MIGYGRTAMTTKSIVARLCQVAVDVHIDARALTYTSRDRPKGLSRATPLAYRWRPQVPEDRKVCVIGIDAIDPELLRSLAQSGRMPTLRSLLDNSVCASTDNSPYIGETPWPNFFTAVNPARHGRYFHSQIVPGSYRTKLFHARDIKAPPYWSTLSAAGKRVLIVDVPKSHVAGPLNGIQIVDWASHDQEITAGLSSWPRDLARQLDDRFGRDPIAANDFGGNGPRDFRAYRDAVVANIERKTRLATALMSTSDWDHSLIVYDDGHHVGHYAWHLHDQQHPDYDPALRQRYGDPLESVCIALDSALEQILEKLQPDCLLAIVISGGIGPNYHATYILDSILRRLEGVKSGSDKINNPLRSLWRSLPVSLNWLLTPIQNTARNILMESDRRRRRAFMLPAADEVGSIRINLVGREPDGLIPPGRDFERFCANLEEKLMKLRIIDTDEPAVDSVIRVADFCTGPYVDHLPDLIVCWNRQRPIPGVQSPDIGTLRMPESNSRRGIHTNPGLLLLRTDGNVRGRVANDVHLMDIAPTICSWMSITLDDVDGKVIPEFADA